MENMDLQEINRLKQIIIMNCTKCKGYGNPCSCQDKFQLEVRKLLANIPPKYRNFMINQINAPAVQKARIEVQEYLNDLTEEKEKGRGLYLWSQNKGTAKTALACITLIEALKKGYSAYFTDLDECIAAIMDGWYDKEKRAEFEKRILHSEFLVIDDIGGMEIKTKGNVELITTVLTTTFRKRSNALRPTILTSNLPLQDVDRAFGERLQSSMHEHLRIIECKGIDYRKDVIAKENKRKKR